MSIRTIIKSMRSLQGLATPLTMVPLECPLIAFWTCSLRILMHHPTFIGNWKQSFFPMIRNTLKPALTNAVSSLPLWFHVMECLKLKPSLGKKEAKSYCETTNFMSIAIVLCSTTIQFPLLPMSRVSQHGQWEGEADLRLCSTIGGQRRLCKQRRCTEVGLGCCITD